MFSGQASTHFPQRVQALTDCAVTPGGRAANRLRSTCPALPVKNWRRDMLAGAGMINTPRAVPADRL